MIRKNGGVFGRNPVFNKLVVAGEALIAAIKGNLPLSDGNLVIGTAGKGIDFSANTHAAGMSSELLNRYEEGTFTPIVYGGTSPGTTTYVNQAGYYTRVGRVVTFQIYVEWSNQTGTGNLVFGGLPFTSKNIFFQTPCSVVASGLTFTANSSLSAQVNSNNTTLQIAQMVNGASVAYVQVDTAAAVFIAGQYIV